jgi:hypothetical protein
VLGGAAGGDENSVSMVFADMQIIFVDFLK